MGHILLLLSYLWALWAFYNDGKFRPSVSPSVWIPIMWLFIHGTRSISMWLGLESSSSRDEGNPIEASINFILILAGLIVLLRRNVQWPRVFRENIWLFVFYTFWAMSTVWSDYPLITFKRLFKDLGNVIMVLVVLTDREPSEAVRAVCVRFAYICIPLSVVFIRYFPEWGRIYVGEHRDVPMLIGVALQKNLLGILVLISAMFLLWDVLDRAHRGRSTDQTRTMFSHMIVIVMCWYLLLTIDSATALICSVIGSLLILLGYSIFKRHPLRLESLSVMFAATALALDMFFNIKETLVVEGLGRNMTLTSRTDIWETVQGFVDNPVVGAGFDTFWAGERLQLLQSKTFGIIQAHNGYVETYLNGGWAGVLLLAIVLVSGYCRIRKRMASGSLADIVRYSLLVVAMIHNFSEASFNKNGPMWFAILFAIMDYRAVSPSHRLGIREWEGRARLMQAPHHYSCCSSLRYRADPPRAY